MNSPESYRQQLISYCQNVDNNGCWTDEQCEKEGLSPATAEELEAILIRWHEQNATLALGETV